MKIVRARTEIVRWQIAGDGAARGRGERAAVLVEIATDAGQVGLGEAAPLPGVGGDTLEAAQTQLAAFCTRVPFDVATDSVVGLAPHTADITSPSARFAIETALVDAQARTAGIPFAAVLRSDDATLACAVVVDSPAAARRAVLDGARTLKIKAGASGDIERILAIHRAAPDAALRIDANGTWPADRALAYLRALAELPIEYVEEPTANTLALLGGALPVPLALDETLGRPLDLAAALAQPHLAALVIKPTVVGGILRTRALVADARAAGKRAVITHALEGPIGTAACAALALSIGDPDVAAGLAPHPALAGWPVTLPYLGATKLRPNLEPGLGLERTQPLATRLDATPRIVDLAAHLGRELDRALAGNDIAVITPARSLRFEDGDSVPSASPHGSTTRARALVATPTLDTLRTIHSALAQRTPLALLHPRLAPEELARQRGIIEATDVPADTAVILFTSGSTGTPRGVVLSHAALTSAASTASAQLGLSARDRWLLALPVAHAAGLAIVVRCRAARVPIVLLEGDFDRARCAALLEQCTLASFVPTQLAALLDEPAWRPPPKLRAVLLGGAAASPALLDRAAARGFPFLLSYGLTETFGQIVTSPLGHAGDPHSPLVPLDGVQLTAGSRAAPARIVVRSPTLATQYLDGTPIAPELTTADVGFVEDGALHILGRADDVIITGGENVHPLSVEEVLAATPGVRAVVVVGDRDERWGQIVCAALVVEPGFDRSAAARTWHARLAAHALPREIALVEALPLLPNGKVDRRAAAMLPRERVSYD